MFCRKMQLKKGTRSKSVLCVKSIYDNEEANVARLESVKSESPEDGKN
jgi:hypothetical protein